MPPSLILLDWFYILHSVYLHTADVIIQLSLQRLGVGKSLQDTLLLIDTLEVRMTNRLITQQPAACQICSQKIYILKGSSTNFTH